MAEDPRLAISFLRALRPPGSPDKAVQLFGNGGELSALLTAYGDVHELTAISSKPAPADPRPVLELFGFELRAQRSFRVLDDGALEYPVDESANLELTYARAGETTEHIFRHLHAKSTNPAALLRHLEAKGPILALIQSAGTALTRPENTALRHYLYSNMTFALSDATGPTPALARRTGFSQLTFGRYHGPNKQMAALWSAPSTKILPFRFGDLDPDKHFQLLVTQRAPAPQPPLDVAAERVDLRETVAGGEHLRLWTSRGAVHVWRPSNYRPKSAGLVYYLHGYYVNADAAWDEYRLAEQFAAGNKNALYLVPEGCAGDYEPPFWDDPAELEKTVTRLSKIPMPHGPKIILAHSGGFRTAAPWTKTNTKFRQIQLVDGLYGSQMPRFRDWIKHGEAQQQLVLTSTDTAWRSEMLAAMIPGSVTRMEIPPADDFSPAEKKAPLIYMRSQYSHMELVTEGKTIPFLLSIAPLEDAQIRR